MAEVRTFSGREAGLVLIDADDQLAGFLSGLDDAVASAAGGVEDDVAARRSTSW